MSEVSGFATLPPHVPTVAALLQAHRLSAHAAGYISSRGFAPAEVEETIRSSEWTPAELGKLECRKRFPFSGLWNGKPYTSKTVRPIFVDEPTEIVVITVYTYFA